MALKHTTGWNVDKWHQDGLNTDRDMTNSLKHQSKVFNVFKIQIRDIHSPHPTPHPPHQGGLKDVIIYC